MLEGRNDLIPAASAVQAQGVSEDAASHHVDDGQQPDPLRLEDPLDPLRVDIHHLEPHIHLVGIEFDRVEGFVGAPLRQPAQGRRGLEAGACRTRRVIKPVQQPGPQRSRQGTYALVMLVKRVV